MKKKLILGVTTVALLAFSGSSFADYYETKIKKNGVVHTVNNEQQVSTKVAALKHADAKKLMAHLNYNLPTYFPEGYSLLDEVGYDEPPEEFPNGVKTNVKDLKEVKYRIQNPYNTGNFYDLYVKKGDNKVVAEGVKQVKLAKGIDGEISILSENKTILLSWKQQGTSYVILGYGDEISQEEVLKIANSIQ